MIETPTIVDSPAVLAAVIRVKVPRADIQKVMGPGLQEIMGAIASQGMKPTGPWFTHHFKTDPATFDFEICVPVPRAITPVGRVKSGGLPAAKIVRTVYHGGFEGLGPAWGEFDAWTKANGPKVSGELWERYLVGPEATKDPAEFRTELMRPLA